MTAKLVRPKQRCLVTGGAGFIGSHLVDGLIAQGYRVWVLDDLSSGYREYLNAKATFLRFDVRSLRLRAVFRNIRPSYVFHLAAQKSVQASIRDPLADAEANIVGSINVMERCRQQKVRRLIFASTGGAVYGKADRFPTSESAQPRPESPYAISKFAVERYLRFYTTVHGLPTVSLRYANVYGPRQDPEGEAGVVAIFANRLGRRQALHIHGTGTQTRDYVYVADVVRASMMAMSRPVSGEVNIGTGKETTVNTLATMMVRLSGSRMPVRHGPAMAGEVRRSALSNQRAQRLLKWKPRVPLEVGLKNTFAWMKRRSVR